MTEWQILWKVEVPLGLPLLIGGLRSAALAGGRHRHDRGLRRASAVSASTSSRASRCGGSTRCSAAPSWSPRSRWCSTWSFAILQKVVVPRGVTAGRPNRRPHLVSPTACGGGDPHKVKEEEMMFTARNKGRLALTAAVVGAALALAGCTTGDPLAPEETGDGGNGETIVVGSQAYYSNEIIAEIYAQALENAGFTVERQFQIGQRDAYIPELEAGDVDLFPEYTGNLLQFYDPDDDRDRVGRRLRRAQERAARRA